MMRLRIDQFNTSAKDYVDFEVEFISDKLGLSVIDCTVITKQMPAAARNLRAAVNIVRQHPDIVASVNRRNIQSGDLLLKTQEMSFVSQSFQSVMNHLTKKCSRPMRLTLRRWKKPIDLSPLLKNLGASQNRSDEKRGLNIIDERSSKLRKKKKRSRNSHKKKLLSTLKSVGILKSEIEELRDELAERCRAADHYRRRALDAEKALRELKEKREEVAKNDDITKMSNVIASDNVVSITNKTTNEMMMRGVMMLNHSMLKIKENESLKRKGFEMLSHNVKFQRNLRDLMICVSEIREEKRTSLDTRMKDPRVKMLNEYVSTFIDRFRGGKRSDEDEDNDSSSSEDVLEAMLMDIVSSDDDDDNDDDDDDDEKKNILVPTRHTIPTPPSVPMTNGLWAERDMKLNNTSMLLHKSASLPSVASIRSLLTTSEDTLGSFKSDKRNTGDILDDTAFSLIDVQLTGDL